MGGAQCFINTISIFYYYYLVDKGDPNKESINLNNSVSLAFL